MAAIGRLDIARAFKRLLELTGSYEPAIGEGIVPTIQIFDLERTPFGATAKWCMYAQQVATVAAFSHLAVTPGESLGENGWLTVDEIWIHNSTLAPAFINIVPTVDAGVPFLATMVSPNTTRSRRQPGFLQGTVWLIPEVIVSAVANATATAIGAMRWFVNALETTIVPVDVALRRGGVLLVSTNVVNQDLLVTFIGRIHMTTAK